MEKICIGCYRRNIECTDCLKGLNQPEFNIKEHGGIRFGGKGFERIVLMTKLPNFDEKQKLYNEGKLFVCWMQF